MLDQCIRRLPIETALSECSVFAGEFWFTAMSLYMLDVVPFLMFHNGSSLGQGRRLKLYIINDMNLYINMI